MIQPQQLSFDYSQPQFHRRWTPQEVSSLMKVVEDFSPKTTTEWKEVSLQMHSQGFRHKFQDYKLKFNSEKAKQQRASLKQNKIIYKRICQLFQQGNSPSQISDILQNITPRTVETTIQSLLIMIKRVMARVVGRSRVVEIKVKDRHFFKFLKENQLEMDSIDQIEDICQYWKKLKTKKEVFKQMDSQKFQRTKEFLQSKIKTFNESLVDYTQRYKQNLQNTHSREEVILRGAKTPTVASIYLRNVSKSPNNFRDNASTFPVMVSQDFFDGQISKSVSLQDRMVTFDTNFQRQTSESLKEDAFNPTQTSFHEEKPIFNFQNFQKDFQMDYSLDRSRHFDFSDEIDMDF